MTPATTGPLWMPTRISNAVSESVLRNLDWPESVGLAQFSKVGEDDRIQEAMQRWQNEEITQKEKVKEYLAGLSAAP